MHYQNPRVSSTDPVRFASAADAETTDQRRVVTASDSGWSR